MPMRDAADELPMIITLTSTVYLRMPSDASDEPPTLFEPPPRQIEPPPMPRHAR